MNRSAQLPRMAAVALALAGHAVSTAVGESPALETVKRIEQAAPPAWTGERPESEALSGPSAASPALKTAGGLTLYSIGEPTDEEQLYVELINRARLNPPAEALLMRDIDDPFALSAYRFFEVDLDLMVSQVSAYPPAPPVSIHPRLTTAARGHSQNMLDNNYQAHIDSNGKGPGDRITAAGYQWSAFGENVFAYAESVLHGHAGFEVDWGNDKDNGGMQNPPGHRITIHNGSFREVGVGVIHGSNVNVGPQLVTQKFASRPNSTPFVTGVAYYDLNGNHFYDPGEGLGGVTVTVNGAGYYAVTSRSGGYSVPVPGNGTYTVTFSLAGLPDQTKSVNVSNGGNVKADFTPPYAPPVVSGPNEIAVNQNASFAFSAVAGAREYQWRRSRTAPASFTEGAEGGLGRFTAEVSGSYSPVATDVRASGTSSFHLAHVNSANQYLTLNAALRPGASGALTFQRRLAVATAAQAARVQVSTDGGSTWTDAWSQAGKGQPGETGFTPTTVPLSGFAGMEMRVRFAYTVEGQYFIGAGNGLGFYFDDVRFTNVDEVTDVATADLSETESFLFRPTALGDYLLDVRPIISGRPFPWGPARRVTVSNNPAPSAALQISGIRLSNPNQIVIDFHVTGGNPTQFEVHSTAAVTQPWTREGAAVIAPNGGSQYRATLAAPASGARYYRILAP